MADLQDTETPGRINIIIFPNGGKEVIGRIASYPPTPESAYLDKVRSFVGQHQGLSKPTKYTGRYNVKDGVLSMLWTDWAGEIPRPAEELEPEIL